MSAITEKKILTDDEIQRLSNTLYKHRGSEKNKDGRNVLMISLVLHTGARRAELLLLKPSDIGDKSVTITAVKSSNDRTIPLPIELYRDLVEYVKKNDIKNDDRIFPISTRMFSKIFEEYQTNCHINSGKALHSLRHTFATKLYENCENIYSVKFALGHKSITNTEKYQHFVEGQKSLRSKMQGMFKKKAG